MRSNRHAKFYNVLEANYCIKTAPYFSMGYKFKCDKNTFYGLNIHPPVRISKNISGQMILRRPSWRVFLKDFAQNPPLECKQCCKRISVLKHRHIFLRANFKYHKNTLYGLNIHPPVRISKNISG